MATVEVKPYDFRCVEEITHELFHSKELQETKLGESCFPVGLVEIPADSFQLILNGLSEARWFVRGDDRDTLLKATGIISHLRDTQRRVEHERKMKEDK